MQVGSVRTILVIDDSDFNREILAEILEPEYFVLQAENGKVGFDLLKENAGRISLILLDIQMPVMNGYEFLEHIRQEPGFSTIPVIVTTASDSVDDEIRCLEEGASDFVTKPYNTDVVLKRVGSMIRLKEASSMLTRVEHDSLTGLYTKEFFYERAKQLLESYPNLSFDIICSNIDSFKMINDRYGMKMGDELLRYLADKFQKQEDSMTVCGRIGADAFAVLCVHKEMADHIATEKKLRASMGDSPISNFIVRYGVYENVDPSLPVEVMCDNANIALNSIKDRYGDYIAEYDESIRQKMVREQNILDSMEDALAQQQFTVYYQPKHNLEKDITGGAEALVRWFHPEYGFMNPGEFIPLFERNGFIAKLDFYVWERVCKDLKRWKEAGLPLVPVSINASRADFDTPELDKVIEELADRYGIDHSLIHLEVTESAYTDNPKEIIRIVSSLRDRGFKIELDDFGVGYSSLNMLDELSLDVLKLDMSFVRKMQLNDNHNGIMGFIFSLAEWMKLDTVAEGVEMREQADILHHMGCTYAQGYLYSKPLPREQFEEYLMKETR